MKFNPEEISLCKQIAEKCRFEKLVKEGDWIQQNYGTPCVDLVTSEYIRNILRFTDVKHWFPLWTISDCLEFLRERNLEFTLNYFNHERFWKVQLWDKSSTQAIYSDYGKENKNKTALEACLKAVLTVLEEKK